MTGNPFADAGEEGQQTLEELRLAPPSLCRPEERPRNRLAQLWSEPREFAGSNIQVPLERFHAELSDQPAEHFCNRSERQALVGSQPDARTFED